MTPIRVAGSVLGLVDGAWAVYIAYVAMNTAYLCPINGCPSSLFGYGPAAQGQEISGGLLVAASLVSLTGVRPAFALGAVSSAAVLVTVALAWGTYPTNEAVVAAALSAVTLVVDAVASRPSKGLSEKDSPLNLPVFG